MDPQEVSLLRNKTWASSTAVLSEDLDEDFTTSLERKSSEQRRHTTSLSTTPSYNRRSMDVHSIHHGSAATDGLQLPFVVRFRNPRSKSTVINSDGYEEEFMDEFAKYDAGGVPMSPSGGAGPSFGDSVFSNRRHSFQVHHRASFARRSSAQYGVNQSGGLRHLASYIQHPRYTEVDLGPYIEDSFQQLEPGLVAADENMLQDTINILEQEMEEAGMMMDDPLQVSFMSRRARMSTQVTGVRDVHRLSRLARHSYGTARFGRIATTSTGSPMVSPPGSACSPAELRAERNQPSRLSVLSDRDEERQEMMASISDKVRRRSSMPHEEQLDGTADLGGRKETRPRSMMMLQSTSQSNLNPKSRGSQALMQTRTGSWNGMGKLDDNVNSEEGKESVQLRINSWEFNIFFLQGGERLCKMLEVLFKRLGFLLPPSTEASSSSKPPKPLNSYAVPHDKFVALTEELRNRYQKNHYHNFRHAVDVTHNVFLFLELCEAKEFLSDMEVMALMVAAMFHDVDHPGVNNNFLIQSRDPLAVLYNHKSVLEMHHAALAVHMLLEPKTNIFCNLTSNEQMHIHSLIIKLILCTDMAKHKKFVHNFKMRLLDPEEPWDRDNEEDRVLLMKMLLKCSDLGNVTKIWPVAKKWSYCLADELAAQGKKEKEHGLPMSPLMEAPRQSAPKNTCNFIVYVVQPLYQTLAMLLPKVETTIIPQIDQNQERWAKKVDEMEAEKSGLLERRRSSGLLAVFPPRDVTHVLHDSMEEQRLSAERGARSREKLPASASKPNLYDKMKEFNKAASRRLSAGIDESPANVVETSARSETLTSAPISTGLSHYTQNRRRNSVDVLSPLNPLMTSYVPEDEMMSTMDGMETTRELLVLDHTLDISATVDVDQLGNWRKSTAYSNNDTAAGSMRSRSQDERYVVTGDRQQRMKQRQRKKPRRMSVGRRRSFFEKPDDLDEDERSLFVTQICERANNSYAAGAENAVNCFRDDMSDYSDIKYEAPEHRHRVDRRFGKTWVSFQSMPPVVASLDFLEGRLWQAFMLFTIACALLGEDVKLAFLPKEWDDAWLGVTIFVFCVFYVELVALSVVQPCYFLRFYFWLDLASILTMIPDVMPEMRILSTERVGGAAHFATRAARLFRFVRLIRFATYVNFRGIQFRTPDELPEGQSQIWRKMTEKTSRNLVLGVLLMLITVPLFEIRLHDHSSHVFINSLEAMPNASADYFFFMNTYKKVFKENTPNSILWVGQCATGFVEGVSAYELDSPCDSPDFLKEYGGTCPDCSCGGKSICKEMVDVWCDDDGFTYGEAECAKISTQDHSKNHYRYTEIMKTKSKTGNSEVWLDVRGESQEQALYNVLLSLFIVVLLLWWTFIFSKDANRLLVAPIENMIKFIKELAADPLAAAVQPRLMNLRRSESTNQILETDKIIISLYKITGLLKVALGEAGLGIVASNLKNEGSDFNPMIPGKKVMACFGFCDIRQFTQTTECLQEEVLVFVNNIADIVHQASVETLGFPNKNVGDAFLCIWKRTNHDMRRGRFSQSASHNGWRKCCSKFPACTCTVTASAHAKVSFADRALCAWILIMNALEDSEVLEKYSRHPAIQAFWGNDYQVKLGFGLHVGWAIEGAIGSMHKVDPSYLSSHVNMAARLEAATKQYGVPVLMSHDFVNTLENKTNSFYCRKIDRVLLKGSTDKCTLYTYDLNYQLSLCSDYSEYKHKFEHGLDMYLEGNWKEARQELSECLALWEADKPCQVILDFMAEHQNMKPLNWDGYRALTEK